MKTWMMAVLIVPMSWGCLSELAPESEGMDLYGAGDGFATAGSEEREQVSGSDLDAPLCNGEFISSEAGTRCSS